MRIDAHQHFWKYDPVGYAWIQADWSIRRDYLPSDLKPCLDACQIDGCVAVQAQQSLAETQWLLDLASQTPWVRGVVGWIDLCRGDIAAQLGTFANRSKLVAVRHVVQDEPDDRFLLRPDFMAGVAELVRFALGYDLLIYPRHLPAAIHFARHFPHQPMVLDHLAKPLIKQRSRSPWAEQIRELAQFPNVCCKLSGMVTEADWRAWKPDDFRPYMEVVLDAFGPDRVLYGSDWPVATLAAEYEQVFRIVDDFLAPLSPSEKASILGGNAIRFYQLEGRDEPR